MRRELGGKGIGSIGYWVLGTEMGRWEDEGETEDGKDGEDEEDKGNKGDEGDRGDGEDRKVKSFPTPHTPHPTPSAQHPTPIPSRQSWNWFKKETNHGIQVS